MLVLAHGDVNSRTGTPTSRLPMAGSPHPGQNADSPPQPVVFFFGLRSSILAVPACRMIAVAAWTVFGVGSGYLPRTVSTGHVAWLTILYAVACGRCAVASNANGVLFTPSTIKSVPNSSASSRIRSAGGPVST